METAIDDRSAQAPWLVRSLHFLLYEAIFMRLLRANDVAEILACSASEVYALKAAGVLPYLKISGMVRFREEDIVDFINSRVVVPPSAAKRPSPRLPPLKHLHL